MKEKPTYRFYGAETPSVAPIDRTYAAVGDQRALYDLLKTLWSAETCAPRLRPLWSTKNRTLGQCSITSFLVQDIYGGEVYGVPLAEGGFHCYNVVNGVRFDLTSEQFGEEKLLYDDKYPQSREEHFKDEDKFARYSLLKSELEKHPGLIKSPQSTPAERKEVVAALIWRGNRFMICRRPEGKARAGLWEFVGGKAEQGETLAEALVRECHEEIGVTVAVGDVYMTVTHDYPDLSVHLTLFRAEIVQGEPAPLEHQAIAWITASEIDDYDFCPADVEIIARLKSDPAF